MVVFHTDGSGFWSKESKPVAIEDMNSGYINDECENGSPTFGELRVYFDTDSWNISHDGLIYTDKKFLKELKEFLDSQDLASADVSYSEQGMQAHNYVSLDVGNDFLGSWRKKFQTNWLDLMQFV